MANLGTLRYVKCRIYIWQNNIYNGHYNRSEVGEILSSLQKYINIIRKTNFHMNSTHIGTTTKYFKQYNSIPLPAKSNTLNLHVWCKITHTLFTNICSSHLYYQQRTPVMIYLYMYCKPHKSISNQNTHKMSSEHPIKK